MTLIVQCPFSFDSLPPVDLNSTSGNTLTYVYCACRCVLFSLITKVEKTSQKPSSRAAVMTADAFLTSTHVCSDDPQVESYIALAREEGGTILTGGCRPEGLQQIDLVLCV